MDIPISRSEKKRRLKQLENLVEDLSKLPAAVIDALPCSNEIIDLLHQVASLKGSARKREIKYINKLLRNDEEAVERLYLFMDRKQGADLQHKKDFHELEYVRDSLVNEAIEQCNIAREYGEEFAESWQSNILDEIARDYPEIDRILLGRLAWLYARTRNRKHSREIFRVLRAAQEQKRFTDQQVSKESKQE